MTEVNGLAARVDTYFVVATLKTLLRFETQNPPGNVEPAVLALRDLLAATGVQGPPVPSDQASAGPLLEVCSLSCVAPDVRLFVTRVALVGHSNAGSDVCLLLLSKSVRYKR